MVNYRKALYSDLPLLLLIRIIKRDKKMHESEEGKGSEISEQEKTKRARWALIGRFKATLNGEQKRVFEKIMGERE